jgi:acyl-CoA thioester hydrolase
VNLIDNPQLTEIHREIVRSEWCDYNGHMNLAYYVLIFDHATDAFFRGVGLDQTYRDTAAHSTFAVESHITYEAEVLDGAELFCTTQLLDFDEKRIHYFHRMYHAEEGFLAATTELMSVHVDLGARRVVPMPDDARAGLAKILESHASLPKPEQLGRVIGIKRKNRE